jgi:hypothetical protein
VDNSELVAFQNQLQALENDIPEIMDQLAVGEGRYARDQARKICKEEGIVNTGDYRRNFKSGTKAIRAGRAYKIDVFNNLDYAKPLEYGFRSHFVPGHWEGSSFVYQKNDPEGGMFVGPPGGFVRGHFTLLRAVKRTKTTQAARLNRKMDRIIMDRLK